MNNLTLSEKYVLLTRNEKDDVGSLFGNEKQGVYITAIIELFCNQIISNSKHLKIVKPLPEAHHSIKLMYDYITDRQGKSITSIVRSFTNPFNGGNRKRLREAIIRSLDKKASIINLNNSRETLNSILVKPPIEDTEMILLSKVMVELKVARKFMTNAQLKDLKSFLKNNQSFNEEIKLIMKVIDGLAVAGALAGAGVT